MVQLTVEEKEQIDLLQQQMLQAVTEEEVRYYEELIHNMLDGVEERTIKSNMLSGNQEMQM